MPTIYLGLNEWPQIFSEIPNQHFFIRSRDRIKLLEYDLQMFQVCNSVYNVLLLLLSVLFDLTSEIIYIGFQITKVLIQKCLEFFLGRQNQGFIIQLLLVLLPVEIDVVLEKRCNKRYAIRFFYSGSSKVVFILLIKIVIGHIIVTSINIQKTCLKEAFLKVFYSRGFGFYHGLNDILYFLFQINS